MNNERKSINSQQTIALVLYACINLLFIIKYSLRVLPMYGSTVLGIVYIGLLWLLVKLMENVSWEQHRKLVIITTVSVTTALIICQLMTDPYQFQVDRWSAIHFFLKNMFDGIYPYSAQTHLGGYGSPFPIWNIFHIPFYLIGRVGLSFVVGIALFTDSLRRLYGLRRAFMSFILLITSPAYLYEVVVNSDLLTNFLIVSALLTYLHRHRVEIKRHPIGLGILVGLMTSTRFSAVIPFAVYYFSDGIQMGVRRILVFLLTSVITFALTFLPFAFWNCQMLLFFEYNPFALQTSQGNISDLLLLIPIGIWTAMSRLKENFQAYNLRTAICLFLLVAITFAHNMWTDNSWSDIFSSRYDITYFDMALPFLVISALYPSKNYHHNSVQG